MDDDKMAIIPDDLFVRKRKDRGNAVASSQLSDH